MSLRIGHLSTFYHTAILLLAEGSAEDRLGVPVDWRLFGTGPAIVEAFRQGELDLAYIGLPPAMVGIASGLDIKCISGGHIEGTAMVGKEEFSGHPGLDDIADVLGQFKGRSIGVPGRGSIHDVILTECLIRTGLAGDIEVVNFRWADQITDALARGDVHAAFGTPALAVASGLYAGCKLIWPPHLLWPDNPSYGIVASRDFLEHKGGLAEEFLALHEEATAAFRERPLDAARKIADYVGLVDDEFVKEVIELSPHYCAQLSEGYVRATMEFSRAMKRLGYIERELEEDEIFDFSFIRKVHPEGHHY